MARPRDTLRSQLSFKALALASIAVIVGALTHVLWDAFTHTNTFVTNAFPALRTELFEYHGRAVRVFFVLQVLSSIFGLFMLWIWGLNLRHRQPRIHAADRPASFLTDRARILAALAIVAAAGASALLAYANNSDVGLQQRVFELLIGVMTGWFLAWCVVAVLITRTAIAGRR